MGKFYELISDSESSRIDCLDLVNKGNWRLKIIVLISSIGSRRIFVINFWWIENF